MSTKYEFKEFKYKKRPIEELILSANEFYDLMKSRRTVRSISSKKVPLELIDKIIETAGTAPSGANKQPWFFAVIKSKEMKEKIRCECEKHEKDNYIKRYPKKMKDDIDFLQVDHVKEFLTEAPYLIIVFKIRYTEQNGDVDSNYYVTESSGIALGMLFSAIQNAGLVTVPYTPMPRAFLREMLELPRSYSPLMILPVGLPEDEAKVPKKSTKSIDEIRKIY